MTNRKSRRIHSLWLYSLFTILYPLSVVAQSPFIAAVDEYVPAPGQFINTLPEWQEGDTAEDMAARCTEALAHNAQGMVCLGAWGGYLTFHFDHSVVNVPDQRDIYIQGNCFDPQTSSEPGIILVSQDLNGNQLPDDPWYEISGSADVDSVGQVMYGYEVTYVNPNASTSTAEGANATNDAADTLLPISWSDNLGNSGIIERNAFHTQEYFPLWLPASLTFCGTRLPDNAHNTGTEQRQYWVHTALRYGYADNNANTDTLACAIDLSWAVDPITRTPVKLSYIDFVRVYSGCLQNCGWLGETSTEICGAMDLHPSATLHDNAVTLPQADEAPARYYDLWGRPVRNKKYNNPLLIIKQ